jgi:hypothetical protein
MNLSNNIKQADGNNVTATSTNNNDGVGVNVGSAAQLLGNVALGSAGGVIGSIVVNDANTDPAISGGVFAYDRSTPVAKRLTTVIAGSANNSGLLSGAASPALRNAVHKIEAVTTRRVATAIRNGSLNIYTGLFSVAPTNASDSFGNDVAARPTRSVPGKLVYKLGQKSPVVDSYDEKTG